LSFVHHHLCLLLLYVCRRKMNLAQWGLWVANNGGVWDRWWWRRGVLTATFRRASGGPQWALLRSASCPRIPFLGKKIPDLWSILYYTAVYHIFSEILPCFNVVLILWNETYKTQW
jgi:hypothetical protein